ncbi:hypothetical protein AB2T90_11385 [Clostridium butyricum]|uniref:hypothetical protein n=1 Tax=Clostridium butyricum TaxID=1492 RepID=UPI00346587AC
MTYTCSLELKLCCNESYKVVLHYKRHWYDMYKSCILKFIYSDYDLNDFMEEKNMDDIVKLIKGKLKEIDYNNIKRQKIDLKIDSFNNKFNKIKVKM